MLQKKYYIVEGAALPDVFLKVVQAKAYLDSGEEKTVFGATQRVGISRSAFYKYKDSIRILDESLFSRFVTIQMTLRNEPGALSGVLDMLAGGGGNVLSIYQSVSGGGSAAVTVGLETSNMEATLDEIMILLQQNKMVLRCEVLDG